MKIILMLITTMLITNVFADEQTICTSESSDIVIHSSDYGYDKIKVKTKESEDFIDLDLQPLIIKKKRIIKTKSLNSSKYLASFEISTEGSLLPRNLHAKEAERWIEGYHFKASCQRRAIL